MSHLNFPNSVTLCSHFFSLHKPHSLGFGIRCDYHQTLFGAQVLFIRTYCFFSARTATMGTWGPEMIMKTALVADGIDCVCNGPSMDQL